MNKYHARRSWSNLCARWFASMAERNRGEELALLAHAGEIKGLTYQNTIYLSKSPKVTITIDFYYEQGGKAVWEDTKGVLTRDFRTKLIWLKQLQGIEVRLTS